MEVNEFVGRVMSALTLPEDANVPMLESDVADLHGRGFTVRDAIRLMICREEVSPEFDESWALERMAEINAKYPLR